MDGAWRIEITGSIKPAGNELEIGVVNLWPNRLIGDGTLAPEQRLTKTNHGAYYQGKHSLLPSGLLGPVTLQADAAAVEAAGRKPAMSR